MKEIIVSLLLFSSMGAFAQKTNFSGNWVINKSKIEFGQAPEWVLPKSLKVEQQSERIVVSRTNIDQQLAEQSPIVDTLSFNGNPFQRAQSSGPIVTSTMHWLNDQSLTLTRKGSSTTIETWTLDDSGKTLVVNRSVEQSDGLKYTLKAFYDKQ